MKVLMKVSGSISAYKVCDVVSQLVKLGHEVKVAVSKSSLEFVGATTWEGLTGSPVFLDDFAPGRRMDHIYLNDWADLVVLAPATAQSLNSISLGVGSNVLTTLFLSRKEEVPYLIFPAMNPRMWRSPSVQASIANLEKQEGIKIYEPSEGRMACGHTGLGRLKESSYILDQILLFDKKPLNALVTFGGTTEDIDGVRSITNFSTGATGVQICKAMRAKFNVTALGSEKALSLSEGLEGIQKLSYKSHSDLEESLFSEIKNRHYDIVVHAAAVSDFLPIKTGDKKISSSEDFEIKWTKASKILNKIKEFSKNKSCKVVSFKLTHNQSELDVAQKIISQFERSASDFLVHNELSEIKGGSHPFKIWKKDSTEFYTKGESKTDLAQSLIEIGGH